MLYNKGIFKYFVLGGDLHEEARRTYSRRNEENSLRW